MNISNIYRNLKQILEDSNTALISKGLNSANSLNGVFLEIVGKINKLPYVVEKKITKISENDLEGTVKIGYRAFSGCTSLESITIPDSVTEMESYIFDNCTNLTSIYINRVDPPVINSNTFYSDTNINFKIYIPEGSSNKYKNATNWSKYADKFVENIMTNEDLNEKGDLK